MARAVRVGMIDSGCRPAQMARVLASRAFHGGSEHATQADRLGHGAALMDVVAAHCEAARFCVAQVFAETLVTTAAQVASAMDWLCEEEVDLISLSLGLAADREVLAEACVRAVNAGIIVCAAAPARGAPVYPAAYPGVLRMSGDARCAPGEYSHLDTTHADFGGHVRSADPAVVGASAGCAHMSAHVATLLAYGVAAADIRPTLAAAARYVGPERRTA